MDWAAATISRQLLGSRMKPSLRAARAALQLEVVQDKGQEVGQGGQLLSVQVHSTVSGRFHFTVV